MTDTHFKLVSAATQYDMRQSTRRGHNPYALAHYMGAVADIDADLNAGTPLREAILRHTSDRLATVLLKSVGLPALTRDEAR